jgi:hypothetical protein
VKVWKTSLVGDMDWRKEEVDWRLDDEESGRLNNEREMCFVHRVCGSRKGASSMEGPFTGAFDTEDVTECFCEAAFFSLFFLDLNMVVKRVDALPVHVGSRGPVLMLRCVSVVH